MPLFKHGTNIQESILIYMFENPLHLCQCMYTHTIRYIGFHKFTRLSISRGFGIENKSIFASICHLIKSHKKFTLNRHIGQIWIEISHQMGAWKNPTKLSILMDFQLKPTIFLCSIGPWAKIYTKFTLYWWEGKNGKKFIYVGLPVKPAKILFFAKIHKHFISNWQLIKIHKISSLSTLWTKFT